MTRATPETRQPNSRDFEVRTDALDQSMIAEGRSRSREPSREAEAEGRRQGLSLCHNGPLLPDPSYAWEELEGSTVGFRGRAAVELAAAFWPKVERQPGLRQYHRNGHVAVDSAAIERAIQVAPGMVRLRVFDPRSKDPAISQVEDEASEPVDLDGFAEFLQCDDEDCGGVLGADRIVTEFSAASRRNLGRTIASVDWPSVIRPGHRLAAVTLTLPGDWRKTTPQPDVFYRHLRKFDKRYKRATGHSMSCVWKREFQRRKAPHYHLLMPLPLTIDDMAVQDWISKAWYESVGSGDERHLRAGTRVDWSEGMRMSDANRAAAYFCGYSGGKADEKAYQDEAPGDWTNDNGSVGRWWGTLGLEITTAEARLNERQVVDAKRILRRAMKAQKRTRVVSTKRTNQATGEVTYRRSVRRYRLSSLKGGAMSGCTYLTNDGPALAIALARAVNPISTLWPPGQPRPLP